MNHLTQDRRRGDPKLYDKDVEDVYIHTRLLLYYYAPVMDDNTRLLNSIVPSSTKSPTG
jgi:hypothetical protein